MKKFTAICIAMILVISMCAVPALAADRPNHVVYATGTVARIDQGVIYLNNCSYYTEGLWKVTEHGRAKGAVTATGYPDYLLESRTGNITMKGDSTTIKDGVVYSLSGQNLSKTVIFGDTGEWTKYTTNAVSITGGSLTLTNDLGIDSANYLKAGQQYTFIFLSKGTGTGTYISAD